MVQLNLALREINCKIVYFGPGLSGKTTNLEVVHERAPDSSKGDLTSIATESDRTLFFDFMPLNLGTVGGMKTKFQLYTVPGQVYYNSTRKLVLRGADGVIFVADSDPAKMPENIESLDNLEECLREQDKSLADLPHVLQWNKRDLPNAMSVEEMAATLNRYGAPCTEAVARKGDGVVDTFKVLSGLVLEKVKASAEKRDATVRARQDVPPAPEQKEVKPQPPAGNRPAGGRPASPRVGSAAPAATLRDLVPDSVGMSNPGRPSRRTEDTLAEGVAEPVGGARFDGGSPQGSHSQQVATLQPKVEVRGRARGVVSSRGKQTGEGRVTDSTTSRQRLMVSSTKGARSRKGSKVGPWLIATVIVGGAVAFALWKGLLFQ
jgi:signal recognition particle receptor subunit beta